MTEWHTRAYGRENDLMRLNQERNDHTMPVWARRRAAKTYADIVKQLADEPLMRLRSRLIQAHKAGDQAEVHKIELQIRDYEGKPKETGY